MATIEIRLPKQRGLSQPKMTDIAFAVIGGFSDLLDDSFSQYPLFDDDGHVESIVLELTTKNETDAARQVLDAEAAIRSFIESMGYVIGNIVMRESNA